MTSARVQRRRQDAVRDRQRRPVLAMRLADPTKHFELAERATPSGGGGGRGGWRRRRRRRWRVGSAAGAEPACAGHDRDAQRLRGHRQRQQDGRSSRARSTPGANWDEGRRRAPWVDKLDFETGQQTRIFESARDATKTSSRRSTTTTASSSCTHESPTMVAGRRTSRDMKTGTRHEAHEEHRLRAGSHAGDSQALLVDASARRLQVLRRRHAAEGLSSEGTRLPGIIWFYPTEFTTQAGVRSASRGTTNINAFPNVGPRVGRRSG